MNKRETERIARLFTASGPRWIRCYDNGGINAPNGSGDRYTVIFSGKRARMKSGPGRADEFPFLAMSEAPFSPQGIGLHDSSKGAPCDTLAANGGYRWPPAIGRRCHLGKRIEFAELPRDCRLCVVSDYAEIWGVDLDAALKLTGLDSKSTADNRAASYA